MKDNILSNVFCFNIHWLMGSWKSDPLFSTQEYGPYVFQVYGDHPLYGRDVLLYIGLKEYSSSGTRIVIDDDFTKIDVEIFTRYHTGIIKKPDKTKNDDWLLLLCKLTKILIVSHYPAFNFSANSYKEQMKKEEHILIQNYESRGSLMPIISNKRW